MTATPSDFVPDPKREMEMLTDWETRTAATEIFARTLRLDETKMIFPSQPLLQKKSSWLLAPGVRPVLVLGALALGASLFSYGMLRSRPVAVEPIAVIPALEKTAPVPEEVIPSVQADQALQADIPEKVPDLPIKTIEKEPLLSTSHKKGYLSVRVIPWGTVSINGGKGQETPLRIPLNDGRHRLEFFYEPENKKLVRSVQVRPGAETVCVANFRGGDVQCGD